MWGELHRFARVDNGAEPHCQGSNRQLFLACVCVDMRCNLWRRAAALCTRSKAFFMLSRQLTAQTPSQYFHNTRNLSARIGGPAARCAHWRLRGDPCHAPARPHPISQAP
eukprot:360527-Chlamydomonas_euryale.AAC.3